MEKNTHMTYYSFFFFENQYEETLLNQPKSVTRTWWSCGGISSIHTVRASMCLAYWAKLWARELLDLRVCEKEIQEKLVYNICIHLSTHTRKLGEHVNLMLSLFCFLLFTHMYIYIHRNKQYIHCQIQ